MELLSKNIEPGIREIKTEDFSYLLPDEKIAKYPLPERENSKVLIWKNKTICQSVFKNITAYIPEDSMLVFNNTKVVRARLIFFKESGARIEIFCLEPHNPADYQMSFSSQLPVEWRCIVGNVKKWKSGKLTSRIVIQGVPVCFSAETISKEKESSVIRFEWDRTFTFSEIIEQAGIIPIPPYLNRESEEADKTRYQTVYARINGSVAAPTAGLHFTENILARLRQKGIKMEELTLHVGAGTFLPVKSGTIAGHSMHSEMVSVSLPFLETLYLHTGKIIAVGTTSVRSLESLFWLGVQLAENTFSAQPAFVSQWEVYRGDRGILWKDAIANIILYLKDKKLKQLDFSTRIIIVPGYQFRIIDGLFTNFHQPKSTLLMLIGAFLGPDWRRVYNYALENGFRFLSYGDSNFYLKE